MIRVEPGDCMDVLPRLAAEGVRVHAVVCDPPYHLTSIVKRFGATNAAPAKDRDGLYKRASAGFMGKQWDGGDVAFRPETWRLVFNVMLPGAYGLVFSGSRTFDLTGAALREAGFIMHPFIAWIFGQGFPKATRVQDEAWDGWRYGTQALKPAIEPILMVQKPFSEKTGTANILAHGCGAINVDGCRVAIAGRSPSVDRRAAAARSGNYGRHGDNHSHEMGRFRANGNRTDGLRAYLNGKEGEALGRWPANIIHDGSPEVMAAFAAYGEGQSRASGYDWRDSNNENSVHVTQNIKSGLHFGDSGTAARFFKSCPYTEADTAWMTRRASIADACFVPPNEAGASVLMRAAESTTHELGLRCIDYREHSTSATEGECASACESVTTAIQSIARRYLRGSPPERLTVRAGPAKCVATPGPTGTTTITVGLSKSDGFVELATFGTMPLRSERGARDFAASRFHYSSKADSDDRLGSKHPTVKPVDLMAYLCRLVTPPGGTVLDPFAGTGTTGAACMREGFDCILIEREQEYLADIKRRLDVAVGADTPLFQVAP